MKGLDAGVALNRRRANSKDHRLTRRQLLGGLALAGAGAAVFDLAAACTIATPTTKKPTVVNIDIGLESQSLNGLDFNNVYTAWPVQQVHDYLYTWTEKLQPQPSLAADLPKVLDELHVDIPIRRGVLFHNGEELTAEHVAASFNEARVAPRVWVSHLAAVQEVRAIDSSTVRFTLRRPWGLLMQKLQVIPVVHKDWFKKTDSMMGTGPFVLDEYKVGSHIRLKANSKYWGGVPKLAEVVFRFVPDPGARLVNIMRGDATIYPSLGYQYSDLVRQDGQVVVAEIEAPVSLYMRPNVAFKPLDDVRVRQALNYAIDRTRIRDVVFSGKATIGQGPVSPPKQGWELTKQVYPPQGDVERAKALLREAGIKEGQTIEFPWIATADNTLRDLGALVKADWAKVGINASLTFLELADFASRTSRTAPYGMKTIFDFSATASGLTGLTSGFNKGDPFNSTNVDDDEITAVELKAEATSEPTEHAKLAAQWSDLATTRGYRTDPVNPKFLIAYSKKLQGFPEWPLKVTRLDLRTAELS